VATLSRRVPALQVFGTAVLLLGLTALADRRNQPAAPGGEPLAVGLLVLVIGVSLGSNSGYAINPTRDIAPRVFTAIAGWGGEVFRYGRCSGTGRCVQVREVFRYGAMCSGTVMCSGTGRCVQVREVFRYGRCVQVR